MSKENLRGPSDESNRRVAERATVTSVIIAGGCLAAYYGPEGAVSLAGFVLALGFFVHAGEYLAEAYCRLLLWRHTRGYAADE